jgi:hypothetical protein
MTAIFLWLQIVVQGSAQPALQSTFPFVANLEAALKESKDRKAPILFCGFDTWSMKRKPGHSSPGLDEVLEDKSVIAAVKKTVCVLASQEKHGDTSVKRPSNSSGINDCSLREAQASPPSRLPVTDRRRW